MILAMPPPLRMFTKLNLFVVHPAWTSRQSTSNPLGDGDELGVDLALARLARPVTGVYPARLPSTSDDPLGERAILAGFGTLVEGDTGSARFF